MTQHTFLVEIGTEELPPKTLRTLSKAFSIQIKVALDSINIDYDQVIWFATPRRLAVKVIALRNSQIKNKIEKCDSTITQACNSKDNSIKEDKDQDQEKDCKITVFQKEQFYKKKENQLVYRTSLKRESVQELLCGIVSKALDKLPISKMMRWGDKDIKFIRPVHTVTLLLDNKVIPGIILGIKNDRILHGHRFMSKTKEISLSHADQYLQVLLDRGKVMADFYQRKNTIRHDAEEAAYQIGGVLDLDDSLFEEVTSLVEWPVVLIGCFEKRFLLIPKEALVCTMKNDQKYFPVYNTDGDLLPYFIFVVNMVSKDPQQIIVGNEKVIHSRLADAEFFFKTDRKKRLEERLQSLETVLFHKQLGTLREKSDRIESLSAWIAGQIDANIQQAARAGLLSKCDLMTSMVFEFTSIQGIMGMHYARYDGESEAVALAQKEQYYPRFSGDTLPTTLVSCAVAIADKMDTLVGNFGVDQHPKGDKDPFSLRRAALGVLRIIVERKLPLDLQTLTEETVRLYGKKLTNTEIICNDVIDFMLNRFRTWYQDKGHRVDTIQAVLAQRPTRPIDFDTRVNAISFFRTLESAPLLISINKRLLKILTKSNDLVCSDLNESLFEYSEEINLATKLMLLRKKLQPLLKAGHYQDVLMELMTLHDPVSDFFDNVKVMVSNRNVRINRLTLLDQLRKLFLKVADISLLQISSQSNRTQTFSSSKAIKRRPIP